MRGVSNSYGNPNSLTVLKDVLINESVAKDLKVGDRVQFEREGY